MTLDEGTCHKCYFNWLKAPAPANYKLVLVFALYTTLTFLSSFSAHCDQIKCVVYLLSCNGCNWCYVESSWQPMMRLKAEVSASNLHQKPWTTVREIAPDKPWHQTLSLLSCLLLRNLNDCFNVSTWQFVVSFLIHLEDLLYFNVCYIFFSITQ